MSEPEKDRSSTGTPESEREWMMRALRSGAPWKRLDGLALARIEELERAMWQIAALTLHDGIVDRATKQCSRQETCGPCIARNAMKESQLGR